jgi:hypothetical protein
VDIKEKLAFAHPVDVVFKFFSDKAAIETKQTKLGNRNVNVTCNATDSSMDLTLKKETPLDAPAALKKFLGEWNEATVTEKWSGTPGKEYTGTLNVELKGVPVKINGTYHLKPEGKGSVLDMTMTVKCGIPLIGGKLADFVGKASQDQIKAEYEYNKANIK